MVSLFCHKFSVEFWSKRLENQSVFSKHMARSLVAFLFKCVSWQ